MPPRQWSLQGRAQDLALWAPGSLCLGFLLGNVRVRQSHCLVEGLDGRVCIHCLAPEEAFGLAWSGNGQKEGERTLRGSHRAPEEQSVMYILSVACLPHDTRYS